MKYFFDTEFIERVEGATFKMDLISIGIVSEDGREFYKWNKHAPWDLIERHGWLKENVLPFQPDPIDESELWLPRDDFAREIVEFIGDDKNPEFWANYADYDWVVFCCLFGSMCDLPEHFPMFCRDIMQLKEHVGFTGEIPITQANEHSAIEDARWNKQAYEFLVDYKAERCIEPGDIVTLKTNGGPDMVVSYVDIVDKTANIHFFTPSGELRSDILSLACIKRIRKHSMYSVRL